MSYLYDSLIAAGGELYVGGESSHHNLLITTDNLIAWWNIQRFLYAFVMLTGVASFFLGLISFIIDTQPVAVCISRE